MGSARGSRAAGSYLTILLGCGLLATGCGAGPTPVRASQPVVPARAGTERNGEQLKTGQQLVADARASLLRAGSVAVSGSLLLQGVVTPVDIVSDRAGSLAGSVGDLRGALQVQLAKAVGGIYVRPTGDAAGLVSRLGLPATVASPAPGGEFWAVGTGATASPGGSASSGSPGPSGATGSSSSTGPPGDADETGAAGATGDAGKAGAAGALTSFAQPALTATLLPSVLVATPTITSGDVDGTPVVTAIAQPGPGVVAAAQGSQVPALTVSVAVTGDVRLVRLSGGPAALALDVTLDSGAIPAPPTPAAVPVS